MVQSGIEHFTYMCSYKLLANLLALEQDLKQPKLLKCRSPISKFYDSHCTQ